MEGHLIHRLDEFLSHMASRQPDLLALLPAEERPLPGSPLNDWVVSLPQRRLMEICGAWVLETMRRLKETSPLTSVMLRGCLHLPGEFDIVDATAVAIGEVPPPNDPRREEVRVALGRAVRAGILIHLRGEDRYCIPFPVRLSFEGVTFPDPLECDTARLRIVHHFSAIARSLGPSPELRTPKNWRFANLLNAYEYAAELMEELLGIETTNWMEDIDQVGPAPMVVAEPLVTLGRFLGKALIARQASSGARLLAASVAAARAANDREAEAEALDLLAQFHLRRGDCMRAIRVYEAVFDLRESSGDHAGAVLAASAVALSYRELGRTGDAINHFLRGCRTARQHGLVEQEIDTANCAAELMISAEEYERAVLLIRSVLNSHPEARRRFPSFAELLVHKAVALRLLGRTTEARDWFLSALGIAHAFVHRVVESRCQLELGRLYMQEKNPQEAMKWLRRARQGYAELSHDAGLAETYMALYHAMHLLPEAPEGESLLLKAAKAAQRGNAMDLLADSWRLRGELAIRRDDSTMALTCFHQEITARRRTSNAADLADGHVRMAALYLQQHAILAAGTEVLRAQAVSRAHLDNARIPRELNPLLDHIRMELSHEQFDYLVDEVTEELEAGTLLSMGRQG